MKLTIPVSGLVAILVAASLVGACKDEAPEERPVRIFDGGFASADAQADAGEEAPDAEAPREDAGTPEDAAALDAEAIDAGEADASGPRPDATAPPPARFVPTELDDTFRHGQGTHAVDVDGDGDRDVFGAISLDDTVRLYLNGRDASGGGDGSQWASVTVAPPGSLVAVDVTSADVDGDGDLDAAAVALLTRSPEFSWLGAVRWFENQGPMGWTPRPIEVGELYAPRSIVAGDLTGDGRPELVVGSIEGYDAMGSVRGHGLRWLRNRTQEPEAPSFDPPLAIDAELITVEQALLHDVDGDGVLDVLASARGSGELVWYENLRVAGEVQDAPAFVAHPLAMLDDPGGIALAQLDGDAALELVAIHNDGMGGALLAFDPPADPAQPWVRSVIDPLWGGSDRERDVIRIAAGRFNRDALTDVVASSFVDGFVRAYTRSDAGWVRVELANLAGASGVSTGDLDGDGLDEVITSTYEHTSAFDRFTAWRAQP
jgi:hypothetical protein